MCARGVSEVPRCLDTTTQRTPWRPRKTAAEAPAGPAPTINTSVTTVPTRYSSSARYVRYHTKPKANVLWSQYIYCPRVKFHCGDICSDEAGASSVSYVGLSLAQPVKNVWTGEGATPG